MKMFATLVTLTLVTLSNLAFAQEAAEAVVPGDQIAIPSELPIKKPHVHDESCEVEAVDVQTELSADEDFLNFDDVEME